MDSIMSFFKENWEYVGLFVGLLGVFIGILSVIVEVKKKKAK